MSKYVIVLFCVVLVLQLIYQYKITKDRKKIEEEITLLILNNKYQEFYELIDSKKAIKLIPIYNRLYSKMNVAFIQNNDKLLDEVFNVMRKMELSNAKKEDVYSKAFNYYVEKGNEKKSKFFMEQLLLVTTNQKLIELTKRTYSILIEKSDEYLDQLLKEDKELKGYKRLSNDLLLSKIYENKGDKESANKYLEQYKTDAKS